MRILLTLIAAMLCASAHAAFFPNSFTTNANGKFELLLAAPSPSSNWFVVIHVDGNGTIFESPKFYGINTNLSWNGLFSAANGAFTNTLTLNGVPVLTNASSGGSAGSTNYRSAVIWLTATSTNVNSAQVNWDSTNQCYAIVATTDLFFGDQVFTNTPGTNFFQWLTLDIIQDSTGGHNVTWTNSTFAGVNGTFALSTNGGSWNSFTCMNSRQTNGNVAVMPVNNLHR